MLIYIVEDEASIRELEAYALEKSGYEVRCFVKPFFTGSAAA